MVLQVVELLIRKLESEPSFHRKVDLFFLVDSITQCSHNQKGCFLLLNKDSINLALSTLIYILEYQRISFILFQKSTIMTVAMVMFLISPPPPFRYCWSFVCPYRARGLTTPCWCCCSTRSECPGKSSSMFKGYFPFYVTVELLCFH